MFPLQQSDGEKSDQDLVVDDASEISPNSPVQNQHHSNGTASPRENGIMAKKLDHPDRDRERDRAIGPHSPRSGTSSNASTPSNKKMEEKPSTPISKSVTPTNGTNGIGPSNGAPGGPSNGGPVGAVPVGGLVKAIAKPPGLNPAGYPHYLGQLNGASPHELQAVYGAAAAGVHNNLPPGMNNYPRAPMQVGFDPHPQMRAPIGAALSTMPSGKP